MSIVQIVVPVYNAADTIRMCLDSLKNQTFKDWQAILVDDRSTDNSEEIINEYAKEDNRFIYIKLEKNGGSSNARNVGLKNVNSEYVAFLDSDDFWEPNMLESLYTKAQKYNADVVQCRFIYDFVGGKQVLPAGAFKKDVCLKGKALRKVYMKMMTGINMNHACMKLIKSSLIKDIEFDKTLPTAEDLDFCVRLFKNVKCYYFTTDIMYHYCRRENSLTGSGLGFKTKLNSNRRVSQVMLKMLPYWKINTPFYKALTLLRPYIIIFSKLFRIIREKIMTI